MPFLLIKLTCTFRSIPRFVYFYFKYNCEYNFINDIIKGKHGISMNLILSFLGTITNLENKAHL